MDTSAKEQMMDKSVNLAEETNMIMPEIEKNIVFNEFVCYLPAPDPLDIDVNKFFPRKLTEKDIDLYIQRAAIVDYAAEPFTEECLPSSENGQGSSQA